MESNNIFIEKDCMCTALTLLLSLSHNNTILITESIYIVLWSFGGVFFLDKVLLYNLAGLRLMTLLCLEY